MRPFTELCPKPFLPLMGVPLMQYVVDMVRAAGVQSAVFNYHSLSNEFLKQFGQLDTQGLRVGLSDESQKLLGSAGGIKKALTSFEGDSFFYINADVLLELDLRDLALHHLHLKRNFGAEVTLAVFRRPPNSEKYREVIYDPFSCQISRLGELAVGRPFFVGAAVIEKSACLKVDESAPSEFVPEILIPAIQRGRAGVFECSGEDPGLWLDFGSPREWVNAHLFCLDSLEYGGFRSRLSRLWERRMTQFNRRLGQRVWASLRSGGIEDPSLWEGPSYRDAPLGGLGAKLFSKAGQIQYGPWDCGEPKAGGWKGISFYGNRWESNESDAR